MRRDAVFRTGVPGSRSTSWKYFECIALVSNDRVRERKSRFVGDDRSALTQKTRQIRVIETRVFRSLAMNRYW